MLGGLFRSVQEQLESQLPLRSAFYCLDCEIISNARTDECPACGNRSLMSLARILDGSVRERVERLPFEPLTNGPFDITLTVELRDLYAHDVNAVIDQVAESIGHRLADTRASLRASVQPAVLGSSSKAA
jgi:hypothetical protein